MPLQTSDASWKASYTPALDEVGLVSSIRQQVAALSGVDPGHVEVVVRSPDQLGVLPAAVEVAAFRIVSEAVSNTVRHSGANQCEVTICCGERALVVEVRDDGCGIAAGTRPGIGMASMRQRAEELGGSVEVVDASRGTLLRARLPLQPVEALR
jgi:signal transduction histidine kinase